MLMTLAGVTEFACDQLGPQPLNDGRVGTVMAGWWQQAFSICWQFPAGATGCQQFVLILKIPSKRSK